MKNVRPIFLIKTIFCFVVFLGFEFAAELYSQAIIKSDENTFFRLGATTQFQIQAAQELLSAKQDSAGETQHWQRQIQIRRCRIVLEGNLPKTLWHFEMDAANAIGSLVPGLRPIKNGFSDGGGGTANLNILDLWIQHTFAQEFIIVAGLQLDGLTRNFLLSLPRFMALNIT